METQINSALFAKRLQKIMDDHELSAAAFAEKMDIGRATISHLISGRNKPSLDFMMKVISTFPSIDLYWLVYGKKSEEKKAIREKLEDNNSTSEKENTIASRSENEVAPTSKRINPSHSSSRNSEKEIKRIAIFYDDGTFESYEP